ncbi:MAG TPA: hypothetical protein VHW01_13265 [Polyangiaceae bacterium]|jgi:DNA replication protein DnaC|nr:hypothetical protein [Polyangiaceae bacterium]
MITEKEILEALQIDAPELRYRASFAKWKLSRFQQEALTEGWQERFAAAVAEGQARENEERDRAQVASLYRHALAGGLSALSKFTVAEMAEWIKTPRLSALATGYDPARDGGRLVLGPTGIGKSVTGASTIQNHIKARHIAAKAKAPEDNTYGWGRHTSALWVRALDLPNARLQQALGKGEVELVTAAATADYVVLDDLGWESRRAGADDVVAEVLARRYDAGLVTFVTSGMTLEQLRERYSDAIVRRITEAGGLPGKVVDLWKQAALKAV